MTEVLRRAEGRYSETAIDGETVIMNHDSGDFFSLVGTAQSIWLRIDGTADHNALLAGLADEFGVAPADIVDEVDAFLAELGKAGLLAR